jgi:hypothetical protein
VAATFFGARGVTRYPCPGFIDADCAPLCCDDAVAVGIHGDGGCGGPYSHL